MRLSIPRSRSALRGRLSGPIAKYYLYVAAQAGWFVMPILTLFLLDQGLSFTEVSVLNAVWWGSMVLGEIPTGYVGDRIGRRSSLLLGSAVSAVSVLVFGLLSSFPAILVVYTVWGVGVTFRSGSESAWLYDTLAEQAGEEEFTRVRGRGNALRLVSMGLSALAGGYLAGVDLYLPFVATAVFSVLGGLVAATIPKNRAYRGECQGPPGEVPEDCPDPAEFGPRDAWPVVRDTLTAPPLRAFVLAVGVFYAVAWSTAMYTQPIVENLALGAGMAEGQVVPLLGWLYAGFSGVSALVSYYADRIESVVGPEGWALGAPILLGVVFLATLALPLLAVPAFFLMRALLNTTDVLKERYLNDHAESLGRATVLSAASMLFGLARVPLRVLSGVVGDATSPLGAVGAMGALLVVGILGVSLSTGLGRDVVRSGDNESVADVGPAD